MAIDPRLVSIKKVSDIPTVPLSELQTGQMFGYTGDGDLKKVATNDLLGFIKSGIKGTATQANAPTVYSAETYPDGLFERYVVSAPLAAPNNWGNIVVTQEELNSNVVFFNVKNGVVTKHSVPVLQGKSAYQVAVDNGFVGTEQQWLDTIKPTRSIAENGVQKTATSGLTDTYTVTFTDGSTTTFNVTNGAIISGDTSQVIANIAAKFDKAGGQVSGPMSIGNALPNGQLFNAFNQIKILNDELKSVIIGEGVNSAGAKLYQIHKNYTWTVPTYNPGMIGMYADLYLHQVASAASTVVANESYVNMSMAEGVTNAGRSIGYLGGVMVMSGHKGRIDNASGAQIINRIRPSAAGIVGSMSGVQAGLTAYDTNTTAMGEFRAFENLLFPLRGATIQDVYGMYLNPSKITGVVRGWGVYQSSIKDVNHFAGKVRIGYVLGSDIPDTTYMVDVRGSVRISEGVEVGGFNNLGNYNIRKATPAADSATNYLVNNSLRWTLDFAGAENGNVSGSNLTMYRYADDGSYLGMMYNLNRATGEMEIGENLKAKKVQLKTAALAAEPVNGMLEFDGTDLYFTTPAGRKKVTLT